MEGIDTLDLMDKLSSPLGKITDTLNAILMVVEKLHITMDKNVTLNINVPEGINAIEGSSQKLIQAREMPQMKKWSSSESVPIFQDTGFTRLNAEMKGAFSLIDTLKTKMDSISSASKSMGILPTGAVFDIQQMDLRIQEVHSRLEGLKTLKLDSFINLSNLSGDNSEKLSGVYEGLRNKINEAVKEQEALNEAMENGDLTQINNAYNSLQARLDSIDGSLQQKAILEEQFGLNAKKSLVSVEKLKKGIDAIKSGLDEAKAMWASISGAMSFVEDYSNANKNLSLINDGTQTQIQLQQKVLAAANATGMSYMTASDMMKSLGTSGQTVFQGNDEMLGFMDSLNKSLLLGNASASDVQSVFEQMNGVLSGGSMSTDVFDSMMKKSPQLLSVLSEGLNIEPGGLRQMAAEGSLTAELIAAAFENQKERINTSFDALPMTFSGAVNAVTNTVGSMGSLLNTAGGPLQAITDRVEELSIWLSSSDGQIFFTNMANAISLVVGVLLTVFDIIFAVASFISSNWSIISPILFGIVTALLIWQGVLLAITIAQALSNIVTGISNGLSAIAVAKSALKAKMSLAEAAATSTATGAQVGLNAALLACPITWVILAVIALIAVFFAVIAVINKVAGTSYSAVGLIVGVIFTAVAALINKVILFGEIILGQINLLINPFIDFANFLMNFLDAPISSIIYLFQNLADNTLQLLESLASAIDHVFGSSLSEKVNGVRVHLKETADGLIKMVAPDEEYEEKLSKLNLSMESLGINWISYEDSFFTGYKVGDNLFKGFDSNNLDFAELMKGSPLPEDLDIPTSGYSVDEVKTVDKIGSSEVDLSTEDMKTMRDLAEMKNIQNFVTLTPTVSVQTGDINNGYDIQTIVSRITESLEKEIAMSAQGVYA